MMFIQIENVKINVNHIVSVVENDYSEYEIIDNEVEVYTPHSVRLVNVNPQGKCITVNLTNANSLPFPISLEEFDKLI